VAFWSRGMLCAVSTWLTTAEQLELAPGHVQHGVKGDESCCSSVSLNSA
jgi:hypothetical protein